MRDLFRLGDETDKWTQKQVEAFMDDMEAEMFDSDRYRGQSSGEITSITREDEDGNETTYVKEGGVWINEDIDATAHE